MQKSLKGWSRWTIRGRTGLSYSGYGRCSLLFLEAYFGGKILTMENNWIKVSDKLTNMKSAEEILKPYIETPFRHTQIVEKDNALIAMQKFADQFRDFEWIAIKDQKPADYERVLYFDSRDGNMNAGYFVFSQTPVDYVTHWMPLPEPPKD